MHYITDSLLVGNLTDAQKPPTSVSAILFVGDAAMAGPGGVAWSCVPLREYRAADPHDVRKAVEWLEAQAGRGRVMVCCRAGMGRSVSMIIAYLCCSKGMRYQDALELLKQRRPGATPLPQLQETIEQVRQLRQERERETPATEGAAAVHTKPSSRPLP